MEILENEVSEMEKKSEHDNRSIKMIQCEKKEKDGKREKENRNPVTHGTSEV